ncbi:MAG: hypothetical protein ACXVD0_07820 [Nocardioides sp.]
MSSTPTPRGARRLPRALATAAALALVPVSSTLVAPAQAADTPHDPAPASAGASWLQHQLTAGVVHNDEYDFDDIGLTADVALGLAGLGGHQDTVSSIAATIAPRAHDEWYTSTYQGVTTVYAGSLAKAVVLAQQAGQDPTSFGGHDLVADLEAHVAAAPPVTGRVEDENNAYGDTNTIGQAFAAQGLATAGSSAAASVTSYLLEQQCSEGYFRLSLSARDAAAQTCDGGKASGDSAPDTDVTSLAVLALLGQTSDPAVATALTHAESWLKAQQRSSGAFGGGPSTAAPNANSTGLAGWALGSLGDTAEAERAAGWVRAHQLVDVGACTPFREADLGGIAYDGAGVTGARSDGITAKTQDRFRRATSQALPALQWAPAATGDPQVLSAPDYRRAGSTTSVGLVGLAPGASACAVPQGGAGAQAAANAAGEAHVPVHVVRADTGPLKVQVTPESGAGDVVTLHVLGPLTVPFGLKATSLPRGSNQLVKVHGLAPGEQVRVLFRGHRVASGQAGDDGRFRARFPVTGASGPAKVTVLGEFAGIRRHAKTFTVTR